MAKEQVTLSANELSEKWGRRLKASVPDIQRGIEAVKTSPGAKAALKVDKALQGYTEAVTSGRMARALNAIDLQDWKNKTSKKVAERLSGGVDSSMPKRQKFDEYLVSTVNAGLAKLKNMPDMTFEDSMARIRTQLEHMRSNPYKK